MSDQPKSIAPTFFLVSGLLAAGGLLLLVLPQAHYYFLSPAARPLHPAHAFLRSSGIGGLWFGIAGTALIFLNLTYLIRKQFLTIQALGSLRSWMSFHVFTGLTGGMLVLLHSAFHPHSALGLFGFVALGIVIATGLVGRYIYAHTPRSLEGRELELDEIRKRLAGYRVMLEKLGTPASFFEGSIVPVHDQMHRGLSSVLVGLIQGDQRIDQEVARLRTALASSPALRLQAAEIVPLAQRYARERQWVARYQELRGLMSGWRFLHRWLAILLLSAAVFHILVAIRMGNLWVLGH